MSAQYQFLPWIRQGAATAVRTRDTLGAGLAGRATLPLKLRVNQKKDVSVTLRLFGPADVTGFDTRIVLRTDPPHLAADFEPNYFPSVELAPAELPWMLTPATGDAQGRLRPWLCLVVVRKQPGVSLTMGRERPLPVLRIAAPARPADELPDLAESWAWAHCQLLTAEPRPASEVLGKGTGAAVARLVCPRRLQASQSYYACLVPTFKGGRKAGLGEALEPADEEQLEPAWTLASLPEALELPVYFHWEFSTGVEGDFESLARRLRGQPAPEGVGRKRLHVGDAGFGMPDGGVLPLEGALRLPNSEAPAPLPPTFQQALQNLLNLPDALRQTVNNEPIVAPPIYGSWQAAQQRLANDTPQWVRELNLDPRFRAAAGLGTLVVQDQQEALMASAWEQLGEPGRARRTLLQQELGREVLTRVHARLANLSPENFVRLTGPLHAKVRVEATATMFSGQAAAATPGTVREQIRRSRLPATVVSGAFRRVTRPGGPVMRRVAKPLPDKPSSPLVFATFFETKPAVVKTRAFTATDTVSPAAIEQRLKSLVVPSTMLNEASQFSEAVRAVNTYLSEATGVPLPQPRPGLVLGELKALLVQELDPGKSLPKLVTQPQARAATSTAPEQLPGPSFPQPMYEPLRDLAPDLLLPGLDLIPRDSVTLLKTNPQFIAAYMVGLNHEMSRELLWREYPSDLRATAFRRFWGGDVAVPDIHTWTANNALGSHLTEGSNDEHLVLLIRGELLHRYPDTLIYAVPAVNRRTPGTERRFPIFRAALGPDITCLGFDLGVEEARGGGNKPGWFFAIEQPPGRARFGMDKSEETGRDPANLTDWNALSWGDMANTPEELEKLTHAPVAGRLLRRRIGALEWGLNAGHMAAITLQRPVRLLQHAADLLPATA